MNDQNINQKRSSTHYILNAVLLIIVFAVLILGIVNNLAHLCIQLKFDIDTISIVVLLGISVLSWLGVINLKKDDMDSNVTGMLIFIIILSFTTSGIINW